MRARYSTETTNTSSLLSGTRFKTLITPHRVILVLKLPIKRSVRAKEKTVVSSHKREAGWRKQKSRPQANLLRLKRKRAQARLKRKALRLQKKTRKVPFQLASKNRLDLKVPRLQSQRFQQKVRLLNPKNLKVASLSQRRVSLLKKARRNQERAKSLAKVKIEVRARSPTKVKSLAKVKNEARATNLTKVKSQQAINPRRAVHLVQSRMES